MNDLEKLSPEELDLIGDAAFTVGFMFAKYTKHHDSESPQAIKLREDITSFFESEKSCRNPIGNISL